MANRTPLLLVVAALAATLLYVSWPADGGDAEVPVAPAAAQPAAPEAGNAAAATLPAGTERVEVAASQQAAAAAPAGGPRGEGRITGIVQDEAGVPAAEVEVSWGPATSVFFGFGGGAQQQDRKARTDASGRFELGGLAAGDLLVRTASPRFLPTQTQVTLAEKQQKSDIVLVVKEGKGIAGFVVDDRGAVVPGARVVAQRREERGSTIVQRFVAGEATTTDERGWFLLRNLEGDKATIRASLTSWQTLSALPTLMASFSTAEPPPSKSASKLLRCSCPWSPCPICAERWPLSGRWGGRSGPPPLRACRRASRAGGGVAHPDRRGGGDGGRLRVVGGVGRVAAGGERRDRRLLARGFWRRNRPRR